jgi:hypothetical protein
MDRRHKAIVLTALLVLVSSSSYIVELNDFSLDLADRELLLIVTDSMDGDPQPYRIPSVPRNSLILVDHGAEEYRIGDVAGYAMAGVERPYFHRIVSINGSTVTLRGDNTDFSEDVPAEDLVGKVVGADPTMGKIILALRSSPALVVMASVVLLIVIDTAAAIVRSLRRD